MKPQPPAAAAAPNTSRSALYFMGAVALFFGYLVTKEITLPRIVLVFGAAIGGILLLLSGVSNPHVITYALVAYLPFSRELVGDFGGLATALNATNVLMIFIIFVWLTGKYAENEPLWLSTPLNPPIYFFLFIALVSIFRGGYYGSGYSLYAIIEFKRWVSPILMFFLVLNTVKDRNTIKTVVGIMMIVTTIGALMAIYDYIEIGNVSSIEKARVGGIANQPNQLAAFFNYYMFMYAGFFFIYCSGNARAWLLWIPFLLCFRGIMVTFSRGGYISFAFAVMGLTFLRSKILFAAMIFLAFMAVLYPVLLPAGIRYRMGQTFTKDVSFADASAADIEGSLDASAHSRVEVWKGAVKMIADHPFLGVGYGLFDYHIKHYWSGQKAIDAHNTYLILAAEMGIPALIVFLWIIWVIFWQTYGLYLSTQDKFIKAVSLGFLGGLFGLLMSNMFGSRLDSQEISSYFWIYCALIMRLQIIDKKERVSNLTAKKIAIKAPQTRTKKLDSCWNQGN